MHLLLSSKLSDHAWSVTLTDVDTDEVKFMRAGGSWLRRRNQRAYDRAYAEAKALADWLDFDW